MALAMSHPDAYLPYLLLARITLLRLPEKELDPKKDYPVRAELLSNALASAESAMALRDAPEAAALALTAAAAGLFELVGARSRGLCAIVVVTSRTLS